MTITLTAAITKLTSGQPLIWESSGAFKGGTVLLSTSAQRRIFKYLVDANPTLVESANEEIFSGLISSWEDEDSDPCDDELAVTGAVSTGPWRLVKIESTGFGGLNTAGGPIFELDVGAESWCLEGYNGSGKTSLTSLILWTLTGQYNREQDGPYKDDGTREPVCNSAGKKIGTWPPLVSYPLDLTELAQNAEVWGRLTFKNPSGDLATATRKTTSPLSGDAVLDVEVDPRLTSSPELIETGLLMPARIAHIGFGSKSQKLHYALKMLTGLDRLGVIASGAAALCHRARRFLKYSKDHSAGIIERDFSHNMDNARTLLEQTTIGFSKDYKLGNTKLVEELTGLKNEASKQAGEALDVLAAEITPQIDLTQVSDRTQLNRAVAAARVAVGDGMKGVPLFTAWGAMKKARAEATFKDIDTALDDGLASLEIALEWHEKQQQDKKLRLKALASRYFIPSNLLHDNVECPLCETTLTSTDQILLAAELAKLKVNADTAERSIVDACADIEKIINSHVPDFLVPHINTLAEANTANAFIQAMKTKFSDNQPFCDVLLGISNFSTTFADGLRGGLPEFPIVREALPDSDIPVVNNLKIRVTQLRTVSALAVWLEVNRNDFVESWRSLLGVQDSEGNWPENSIEGKLEALETAIAESDPLDKSAQHIGKAITAATKWNEIEKIQKVREEIAKAVEPLKELQHLVESETHRTVVTLSGRVSSILEEIRLRDRFSFENTTMTKKAVTVDGSFSPGLKIDASLVANSSWLRALLWAFIFALREQAVEEAGMNNFPLMVLGDPQTTFDPKNKLLWAHKIVALSNLGNADPKNIQLFLTTHERQFHNMISMTSKFVGQQAEIAGPSPMSKVTHIVNGTFLERDFAEACQNSDDRLGYKYIQQVRVYCEDLFRIMLRPESYEINGDTLGKFSDLIRSRRAQHIDPFNRKPFLNLVNLLDENTHTEMGIMNLSHHTFDGTVGLAQAEQVEKFWKKSLYPAFQNAFRLAADFDAYGGVANFFSWAENIIPFPQGCSSLVKSIDFQKTGVAAAAASDGRVGDGQIELEEFVSVETVKLFNHSAYWLNAGTLEPVAGIGDVVLVQNYGEPRSRNLTVAIYGDKVFARRMSVSIDHEDVVVLTGQATDPYSLPEPVITMKGKARLRKIIGTVFMPQSIAPPQTDGNEVMPLNDFSTVEAQLKNVKLFEIKGRSMEPIALEGQFVMTRTETLNSETLERLSGSLVIGVDQSGGVYFKRLRLHGKHVVLESANSNITTSSEILSLSADSDYPQLVSLLSVVGVLFDLPN